MTGMFLYLRAISKPFDDGSKVELKFLVEQGPARGELYLRIPTEQAARYQVGDAYSAKPVPLPC